MKKLNWDKILWSWPMMLLNALCFVIMLFVFAEGCHETRAIEKQKESDLRKAEFRELLSEIKKDNVK